VKLTVQLHDLSGAFSQAEADLAKTITAGVREAGQGLQQGLRSRTAAALGQRVANAWRLKNYPSGPTASLDPAVLVWSRAPKIIDAFDRGAVIVPVNGGKFLAIPSRFVPRKGRGRMTPFEVESSFNQDLIIKRGKAGDLLAFVDTAITRFYAGQGRAYGGKRRPQRQGKPKLVLMFTLVPRVKMRKLLDLDTAAQSAGARVPGNIARHFS
jgi:hypothetical protein